MARCLVVSLLIAMVGCSGGSTARPASTTRPSPPPTTTAGAPQTTAPVSTPTLPPPVLKTSGCVLAIDPDPACTPGAVEIRAHVGPGRPSVDPADPYDICASGYTKTIRPPASVTDRLKTRVAQDYGIADSVSNYEGDHLISLELGGAPEGDPTNPDDLTNFWDEPHAIAAPDGSPAGSFDKDKFENYLHRQVCSGAMALADAQHRIADHWYENWVAAGRPKG